MAALGFPLRSGPKFLDPSTPVNPCILGRVHSGIGVEVVLLDVSVNEVLDVWLEDLPERIWTSS